MSGKLIQNPTYLKITLQFYITQHIRDLELLTIIKKFFNCGNISTDENVKTYRVSGLKNNLNLIIPFFLEYKVQGIKYLNFLSWVQVAQLMKDKKHLTLKGYKKIVNVKAKMNSKRKVLNNK